MKYFNQFKRRGLRLSIYSVVMPIILKIFYIRFIAYNVDEAIYGSFVLIISFIALLSTVLFSVPFAALTRYFNETNNKERFINEFLTLQIPLNIVGLVVISIYSFYLEIESGAFLLLLGYFILLNRYSLNKIVIFQLIKRKSFLNVGVLEKLARFFLPIMVFYFYPSKFGLLIGLVIGYGLLVIYSSFTASTFKQRIVFSYKKVRIYFLYGYPVLFTAVASWIISAADRFFIDHYLSANQVGVYSILAQVAGFGSIFGSIFITYVQPIIYKKYSEDMAGAMTAYLRYVKMALLVFLGVYCLFLALPIEVFTLLISPEVIGDTNNLTVLHLLVLSSILGSIVTISTHFFYLKNKIYVLTVFWLAAAIINIGCNFYIAEYGILAAAFSTCISYLVVVILMSIWVSNNIVVFRKNHVD